MLNLLRPLLHFFVENWHDLARMQAKTAHGCLVMSRPVTAGGKLDDASLLAALEQEIDAFWRSVPFHTLFLNYQMPIQNSAYGGTCSDRAVLFLARLENKFGAWLKPRLHRCRINGRETHTVILISLGAGDYLIDVGSNWPVMHPIPCFEPSAFTAFGIAFRAAPTGKELHVEMKRPEQPEFRPFLSADLTPQPRAQVVTAIADRYDPRNDLPFKGKLRFSCIYGDAFYVLRDDGFCSGNAECSDLWKEYRG